MQKIIRDLNKTLNEPFNKHNILFLDIETDGLSHKNHLVIIGLILFNSHTQTANVTQLFNDDYMSEREMLLELMHIIEQSNIDYTISFNGNSFDIPFLNARFSHFKIDYVLNKNANLDLLRVARTNKELLGISDFKLKTVENYVGINRTDTISGKDSILLYHAYVETQSEALKESILLHNYDDLINIIPLLKITAGLSNVLTPYIELTKRKWYITNTQIKGNALYCSLSLNSRLSISDLYYDSQGIRFECSGLNGSLKIDLQLFKDQTQNTFQFADSRIFHGKPFDQLNNEEKQGLLVSKNQLILESNIEQIFLKTIQKVLELIYE